jgi:hypothetical protein
MIVSPPIIKLFINFNDEERFKKHMYFSGAYWVAKKQVMLKYPLNEQLIWGQGEDVLWSSQVRHEYEFKMNEDSEVKLLRQKEVSYGIADQEIIQKLSMVLT